MHNAPAGAPVITTVAALSDNLLLQRVKELSAVEHHIEAVVSDHLRLPAQLRRRRTRPGRILRRPPEPPLRRRKWEGGPPRQAVPAMAPTGYAAAPFRLQSAAGVETRPGLLQLRGWGRGAPLWLPASAGDRSRGAVCARRQRRARQSAPVVRRPSPPPPRTARGYQPVVTHLRGAKASWAVWVLGRTSPGTRPSADRTQAPHKFGNAPAEN